MCTPASFMAAHLASAVPVLPLTIAPAWPMRLPFGAREPAMKPTTGLVTYSLMNSQAFFFGVATDFTDHDDLFAFRVVLEQLQAVDEVGAVDGVTADTDTGALAQAALRGLVNRFVGQGA